MQLLSTSIADEFFREGFVLLRDVANADAVLSDFLVEWRSRSDLPFARRVVLDNLARIPHKSCQDAIETDHMSLHFEMGLPLIPTEDVSRVHALICLYIPKGENASDVATRLLSIDGLLNKTQNVESNLVKYCKKNGAGWKDFNSGRLLCAAQLFDAMQENCELGYMREDRIAEWFNKDAKRASQNGAQKEIDFFAKFRINLRAKEKSFILQPGDLLIVDNLRVAHGRRGRRPAEELVQYLYGARDVTRDEIDAIRALTVKFLLSE